MDLVDNLRRRSSTEFDENDCFDDLDRLLYDLAADEIERLRDERRQVIAAIGQEAYERYAEALDRLAEL